jgi:osmotically-inducible protein OsmY
MAGVVTLKGTADSQENRQKAEQIASAVDGVRTVKNELVVISG